MQIRKTQVAVAVGAALSIASLAVQAQVSPAQQGVNVQLYGQVNRALMFVDDGHQSRWFHVDGQPSSTRFGINATGQATPGLRVGARLETEMKSNPSDVVNFGTPSAGNVASGTSTVVGFAERWLDLSFEGAWGKVNVGQGSGAADDASTLDLSGTGLANGNCTSDWAGGVFWRTGAAGTLADQVKNTHACNDFESRYDRAMYTTPTFGGFRGQVGFGQRTSTGEAVEASVWYAGKLAGDLQAAIGWSNVNLETPGATGAPDRETIGGSVSWLSTAGFNVTLAYTKVDGIGGTNAAVREGEFTMIKVGYKFGQHAIAVDYSMHDDMAVLGDEGKTYGVGYVWNPVRWVEVYAMYRVFQLDRPSVSVEDVMAGSIGSRIRF